MTNSLPPAYSQYTAWGCAGSQSEFNSLLTPAEATVNACIPVPNEVDATDTDQLTAYQKAICGVISHYNENPDGAVRAYTAGKIHEEFAEAQTAITVATKYLCGSGLLCMWA